LLPSVSPADHGEPPREMKPTIGERFAIHARLYEIGIYETLRLAQVSNVKLRLSIAHDALLQFSIIIPSRADRGENWIVVLPVS